MQATLASNSRWSSSLPSAGIVSVHHHTWLEGIFFIIPEYTSMVERRKCLIGISRNWDSITNQFNSSQPRASHQGRVLKILMPRLSSWSIQGTMSKEGTQASVYFNNSQVNQRCEINSCVSVTLGNSNFPGFLKSHMGGWQLYVHVGHLRISV